MQLKTISLVILFFLLITFINISCTNKIAEEFQMSEELKTNLQKTKNIKVFFGHQSVGNNILNGLRLILEENDISDYSIIDYKETDKLPNSYLLHSKVGENEKPKSKCDAFAEFFESKYADSIDAALLKFCYIDINEDTDIPELFDYYRNTMDTLIKKYPGKIFIHVTAPLVYTPTGITIWAREMLGKPNRNKLANIKRNEFNALLREYYRDQPVFDLADVESTYKNGKRESFAHNKKEYFSLIREYSSDQRHLNELGSKFAAEALIKVIAGLQPNK